MTTIYEQTQATIENKRQWSAGETVSLFDGQAKVFIQTGPTNSGRLDLIYQNGTKTVKVECGYLSLRRGWMFAMDRDSYAAWVAKTGNKIAKPKKSIVQPLAEWVKTPNGQEYMDLPPNPELVQEIAEHNRARVAGRSASQPMWDGWRRRSK